ncbi:MAG: hypothetical protein GX219_00705 [Tissierellia bacterium]|nr:hypothetical protein [Tissierellia bacterium]
MLATGYGIERINSPELKLARESMNSDYLDIVDSAEKIKPLLGLLDDGLYVFADMECFPTDYKGNFFYYVPNEFTQNAATSDYYYNFDFFDVVGGFPLYLYPTQSADLINERRVDEYVEILKESSNPPRALTYYEGGFICALLDGHHKACAAAVFGKKVKSLTILRPDSYAVKDGEKLNGLDTLIGSISFAGIDIPPPSGAKFSDYFSQRRIYARPNEALDKYKITGRIFPSRYSSFNYPTIKEATGFILMGMDVKDVNYLNSLEYIKNPDEESERKLMSVMSYLEGVDRDEAYKVAMEVMKYDGKTKLLPFEYALRVLSSFKAESNKFYSLVFRVVGGIFVLTGIVLFALNKKKAVG